MKQIPLTKGKFAIVDDADFECLIQWKWQYDTDGYARRPALSKERIGGKKHNIRMHRFLLDAPKNMQVDHINGNRLDNRRCNIRLCNSSQNGRNRAKIKKAVVSDVDSNQDAHKVWNQYGRLRCYLGQRY